MHWRIDPGEKRWGVPLGVNRPGYAHKGLILTPRAYHTSVFYISILGLPNLGILLSSRGAAGKMGDVVNLGFLSIRVCEFARWEAFPPESE